VPGDEQDFEEAEAAGAATNARVNGRRRRAEHPWTRRFPLTWGLATLQLRQGERLMSPQSGRKEGR
jgi:hypothetical protein